MIEIKVSIFFELVFKEIYNIFGNSKPSLKCKMMKELIIVDIHSKLFPLKLKL